MARYPSMTMDLTYTLTANDLYAFARYWSAQRATRHKKRFTVVPVALLVAIGLSMLIYPSDLFDLGLAEVLVAIVPPLLIFVVLCLIGNQLHRRSVARSFSGKSVLRLLDDGIHHGDEHTESRTRWEALRDVVETPRHLFLVYGYQQAVIVPKNQVTESDLGAIRETVARHRPELVRSGPLGDTAGQIGT